MNTYRAIKVEKRDEIDVRVKERRRFPYMEVGMMISEGYEVFVPELNRKTAHYSRTVLSNMLGREVLAFPAKMRDEDGYLFKLSIFKEVLSGGREGEKGD